MLVSTCCQECVRESKDYSGKSVFRCDKCFQICETIDIENVNPNKISLRAKLMHKKELGTLPKIEELTDDDWYQLSVVEGNIDAVIAEIFDTTKKRVSYYRREKHKVDKGIFGNPDLVAEVFNKTLKKYSYLLED